MGNAEARQATFFFQNSATSFRILSETSSLTSESNQSANIDRPSPEPLPTACLPDGRDRQALPEGEGISLRTI